MGATCLKRRVVHVSVALTLVIGRYAIDWNLPDYAGHSVTGRVRAWTEVWPEKLIPPHPSPRNNQWLKANPWFEEDVIPVSHRRVQKIF